LEHYVAARDPPTMVANAIPNVLNNHRTITPAQPLIE